MTDGKLSLAMALLLLAGCGGRSGLQDPDPGRPDGPDDVRPDLAPPVDLPPDLPPAPVCSPFPLQGVGEPVLQVPTRARTTAHAFYEPRFDRVAVYGGGPVVDSRYYEQPVIAIEPGQGTSRELIWEPADAPGWTFGGAAQDRAGERVFVVGGWVGTSDDSTRVVQVTPDGPDRVLLAPLADFPLPLRSSAVGYDPMDGRLVVFGGIDMGRYIDRTWVLEPEGAGTWRELAPPGPDGPASGEGAMTWVPDVGLVLISQKVEDGQAIGAMHLLRPGSETWQAVPLDQPWSGSSGPLVWSPFTCQLIWWGGGCTESPRAIRLDPAQGLAVVTVLGVPGSVATRLFPSVAIDERRETLVVQGGYDCEVRGRHEDALAYPLLP